MRLIRFSVPGLFTRASVFVIPIILFYLGWSVFGAIGVTSAVAISFGMWVAILRCTGGACSDVLSMDIAFGMLTGLLVLLIRTALEIF